MKAPGPRPTKIGKLMPFYSEMLDEMLDLPELPGVYDNDPIDDPVCLDMDSVYFAELERDEFEFEANEARRIKDEIIEQYNEKDRVLIRRIEQFEQTRQDDNLKLTLLLGDMNDFILHHGLQYRENWRDHVTQPPPKRPIEEIKKYGRW